MKFGAFLVVALLTTVPPAFAHHSGTAFDNTKHLTIKGTIKEFRWANPHAWIFLLVSNAAGGTDEYEFEGMSPSILARNGWRPTTLKPGDNVTIGYSPYKDDRRGGEFHTVLTAEGTFVGYGGPI